jgi:DNA polymerase I
MHRAFHAMKFDFKAPDGTPTNAVFGFFSMFFKYVSHLNPDILICTFDSTKATHRIELFEKYKANRPHMDEDLKKQFPITQEILAAMGVKIVTADGWEADDCMGTISKLCIERGDECYLVTGDKDLNQLVCDSVFTVTTDRKNRDVCVRGNEEVFDKFGVYPNQIVDYLALVGDSSDNIPGVAGIGPKSACDLLSKYKTLDGIYENLSDLKGKKLENLINFKEDAYLSKKLATINCSLDLDVDLGSGHVFDFDEKHVEETLLKYGLRSTLASFKKANLDLFGASNDGGESGSENVEFPSLVSFDEAKDSLSALFKKEKADLSFSLVTPSKMYLKKHSDAKPLVGISTSEFMSYGEMDEVKEIISSALLSSTLVAYDAKDLISIAYPHDSAEKTPLSEGDLLSAKVFDLHVVSNMQRSNIVYKTAEDFYNQLGFSYTSNDPIEKRAPQFAYLNLVLKQRFESDLNAQKSSEESKLFYECEQPLTCVLSVIERNGCALDDSIFSDLSKYCDSKLGDLEKEIYSEAGHEFLIESPSQLSIVLFQEMGIKPLKKNKSGFSTDAKVLGELAAEHRICSLVLKYRELAKMRSTYVDALPKMRGKDNLVHTKFNQAATATGRLSSSDPNLQNIPVRSEFGKRIRSAFLPARENDLFLSADYSQIELRLLAHLSQDENLIDAFLSGEDFHKQTAMRIFGVGENDVTDKMRSSAKAVNFGIIYGQQAYSLSRQLKISYGEAKSMIDRYYESYPGVRKFLDSTITFALEHGYSKTMFGRKRTIPEIMSENKQVRAFGERTAMNHPMQGSAADIIKIAMVRLQRQLVDKKLSSKIMIQVHDELDLSVLPSELEDVKQIVKDIMENVVPLRVPLVVDVGVGNNWAEAH